MNTGRKLKKALKIVGDVVLYGFIILCLICVFLTITAKKSPDGAATIFGQQMRYVQTESMAKCDATYDQIKQYRIKDIPMYSMVFIEVVPEDSAKASKWYDALEIGDVLTFKYVNVRQETITHRLVEKTPDGKGGWILRLEGDNRAEGSQVGSQIIETSDTNSTNYVIGKVVGTNYLFGIAITTLKHPAGIVCLIILPAFVILFFEIFKVVRIINADRKKKFNEQTQKQQNELEELRRRLAELEEQNKNNPPPGNDGKGAPPKTKG